MIRMASLLVLLLALPASAQTGHPPAPATAGTAATPCTGQRWCFDLALLAGASASQASKSQGPALKAAVTLANEIVRIGDLIENAGAVADVPIFRAPDLGQTGAVPASRVIEAVRPHHITGLDTRGVTEVVVTRASHVLTPKDFEARIVRALAGQPGVGEASNLALTFDNEVRTLHVEPTGVELRLVRLNFEPRTGRFDATFDLAGSAARKYPLRLIGTMVETFEAAVLTRPVAQNEILKRSDFATIRRPKTELASNPLTNPEEAAGLAARRALRPGQLIRLTDLMKPELVQKNESVTISYQVPGIVLTVRGQALEAGAQGDVINVLNVQSKKTVSAIVTGPGRVSVTAIMPRVATTLAPAAPFPLNDTPETAE